MTHRYLRGSWWIQRLAVPAERLMPSPWVMRALVFAARHDGEPELEMLPDLVRRDPLMRAAMSPYGTLPTLAGYRIQVRL